MAYHHTPFPRTTLLAAALALAPWYAGTAQAQESVEGTLEHGPAHSVLWAVSPESGDLIGQVFANASQAGQVILAHCLPSLHCVAEDANTTQPPDSLTEGLSFGAQPSGWWLITHARSARMQPNLPLSERELHTRHGQLTITDEYLLLFNGRPVLVSPPQAAPTTHNVAPSATPHTLLARINTWWQGWWSVVRGKLLALLGRMPAPTPVATASAEPVQGNAALHVVAHFEQEGQDIFLLQDSGGTACPALYRFATLTPQGITITRDFGTCSDLATVKVEDSSNGTQEPRLTMVGTLDRVAPGHGPSLRLHHFVLRQGQVQELVGQR